MKIFVVSILSFCPCLILSLSSGVLMSSKAPKTNAVLTPCKTEEDCAHLLNATCNLSSSVCECGNATFFTCEETYLNDILVNKLEVTCENGKKCNVENSLCGEDRKCVCVAGFVSSQDQRRCLRVSAGFGDACEENSQCQAKTPSTSCQSNKCVCQRNMHEKSGSCYRTANLGQECEKDEECALTDFSSCSGSKCTCKERYVGASSRCLPIPEEIFDPCQEDVQCSTTFGSGAACLKGRCDCQDLFQFKAKSRKCVRDVLLDETCKNHTQCHQPGGGESRLDCVLGICKCQSVYREENGYCIKSFGLKIQAAWPTFSVVIYYIIYVLLNYS